MSPNRLSPLLVCAGVSLLVTVVVFATGAVGLVIMMIALNGFSEGQAKPIFAGYLLVVCAANVAILALASAKALRKSGSEPAGQKGLIASCAVGFTSAPFLLVALYLKTGGSF
jgi:hypothetical protein